ncbi:hypothetical protein HGB07_08475 [Candidatus Roizmanbacteria bacterium]|nr:hypothetical protein [Candidatus Roizmanbacteria bacterium]
MQDFGLLVLLCFLVPLFSSTLTNIVNADHRISPLYPLGAIFIGLGSHYLLQKYRRFSLLIFGVIAICIMYQTYVYFCQMAPNRGYKTGDYVSMHLVYVLQKYEPFIAAKHQSKNVCVLLSPRNTEQQQDQIFSEQFLYFVPQLSVSVHEDKRVRDNEAYFSLGACEPDLTKYLDIKTVSCQGNWNLFCPTHQSNSIFIYATLVK